ncbi:MAG: uroporphyrinogen decarboxylase [Bdellovibrionales bacterium]|nr:uroporphyrinogen decarboxylase [Bdellovibrionales bacterium]
MNKLFQNALKGLPNQTPPIWFMRQAGRYHQHYQKLRQKYSFVQLCKTPELAAEVALGPIQDFDFDVAILFSDILFPLEALGFGLEYNPGPQLSFKLDASKINQLNPLAEALQKLEFQRQAVAATRTLLPATKSLIGFIGGPWTLFSYACEGEHRGQLELAKKDGSLYRHFSEFLLPLLIANIDMQLESGAEVVMILDTAAGELSAQQFHTWVEPDLKQIINLFPQQVGYYAKGVQNGHLKNLYQDSRWAGFGYDHRWDLKERLENRPFGFIQGNFDQALLKADFSQFKHWLEIYLQELKTLSLEQRSGWVCGLGHGILPATPESSVKYFIERTREVFS